MTLLISAPDGFDHIGWRGVLRAALVVWLVPGALGALLIGLQWLAGTRDFGTGWRTLWTYSFLLMATPLMSWAALIIAAPFVKVLTLRGWFGWLPALMLGMAIGGILTVLTKTDLMLSMATLWVLALRVLLGRWHPAAFAPRPAAV